MRQVGAFRASLGEDRVYGLHIRIGHPQIIVTRSHLAQIPQCLQQLQAASSPTGHDLDHPLRVFLSSNSIVDILPHLQHQSLNITSYHVVTAEGARRAVDNARRSVLEMLSLTAVDELIAFSGSTFSSSASLLLGTRIILTLTHFRS